MIEYAEKQNDVKDADTHGTNSWYINDLIVDLQSSVLPNEKEPF